MVLAIILMGMAVGYAIWWLLLKPQPASYAEYVLTDTEIHYLAKRRDCAINQDKQLPTVSEVVRLLESSRMQLSEKCIRRGLEENIDEIRGEFEDGWETIIEMLDIRFSSSIVNTALRQTNYSRHSF